VTTESRARRRAADRRDLAADRADARAESDASKRKPSAAKLLVDLVLEDYDLMHDAAGDCWVVGREDRTSSAERLERGPLTKRLGAELFRREQLVATPSNIASAVETLQGFALESPVREVGVRSASIPGGMVLDLAHPDGLVVVVTATGVTVTDRPPVPFWRPPGILSLLR